MRLTDQQRRSSERALRALRDDAQGLVDEIDTELWSRRDADEQHATMGSPYPADTSRDQLDDPWNQPLEY